MTPRPHWAHLMESLRAIGPEELGRRWEPRRAPHSRERHHLQHLQRSASAQTGRGKSTFVPFLIPADEWRYIEAGIIQRAQLLSLHP